MDYELEYVTQTDLDMRPFNPEGWIIAEPGWYWRHPGDEQAVAYWHGPFATARQAAAEAEEPKGCR